MEYTIPMAQRTRQQKTPFADALLAYYRSQGRKLPWRAHVDPYPIWLAEVMLQQTTVATVTPYYARFLEKFPTVQALANAPESDVLHLWQGLGYYSRARNLHKCAKTVVAEHNGHFPTTEADLLALPGIGPYTAAAVAAIAFGEPATVVDGNVERVMSRLFRVQTPLPKARPDLRRHAQSLTPRHHAGDYAQAIMDLGSTVCTPRTPKCDRCPVSAFCEAFTHGDANRYPLKQPKAPRPAKSGVAWCLLDQNGRLYLRQRPAEGLLGGLWEVPTDGWEGPLPAPLARLTATAEPEDCGTIRHVFSHFSLDLQVVKVAVPRRERTWVSAADLGAHPLSTLMRKVLTQAGIL